jgi:hypothetical protein
MEEFISSYAGDEVLSWPWTGRTKFLVALAYQSLGVKCHATCGMSQQH